MLSIEERLRKYEPFFGEWKLGDEVELLGKGQSSYVFTIHHLDGQRTAALKVISIPMDEAALKRLRSGRKEEQVQEILKRDYQYARKEIKLMDKLNGTSNIVYFENSAIYARTDLEDGMEGWDVLIRMEKLIPFERYLQNLGSKRTTALMLRIWDELLEGLKACQSPNLKIVHLDIKPQNIFYAPGTDYFKLGDFSEAQQGDLVAVNCKFGTRGYIPPEIEAKRGGDGRADLYSLALVIYSLLNHDCLPFVQPGAENKNGALDRADKMRWSGQAIPRIKGLDPEVMDILVKCLECDPERRYRSAAEVQNALRKILYRDNSNKRSGKRLLPILLTVAALGAMGVLAMFGMRMFGGSGASVAKTPGEMAAITANHEFRILNAAAGGGQEYVYKGTAEPKTDVNVLLNGEVVETVATNRRGQWSVELDEKLLADAENCTVAFAYGSEEPVAMEAFVYDNVVSPLGVGRVYSNSGQMVGAAEAGSTLVLKTRDKTVELGTATAAENNEFRMSFTDGKVLSELGVGAGTELVLLATDLLGNETEMNLRVQTMSTDTVSEEAKNEEEDSDAEWQQVTADTDLEGGALTAETQSFKVFGTATPGKTLELFVGTRQIKSITVDADGKWSIDIQVNEIVISEAGDGKIVFRAVCDKRFDQQKVLEIVYQE